MLLCLQEKIVFFYTVESENTNDNAKKKEYVVNDLLIDDKIKNAYLFWPENRGSSAPSGGESLARSSWPAP